MAYILASQHSLVHLNCMITSLVMQSIYAKRDSDTMQTGDDWDWNVPKAQAYMTLLGAHGMCLII